MIEEKRWNPGLEKQIFENWIGSGLFKFNPDSKKKFFTIDTPPPYPSGKPWHIGAVAHYTQIDMIARTARAQNKEVIFPIGIDRNGLPVEMYVEKMHKIKLHDTDREKFVGLCATALDELEEYMINLMKKTGISGDYEELYYRTDSPDYRKNTQSTFIELWKKGLIYEDYRPSNYCTNTETTIADAEIEYKEIPTKLVYLKFKIVGEDEIIIATTRPELLYSCAAVVYNPKDDRYKDLNNKKIIVPLTNEEVPLIPHPYAKPEFGSGVVMICSYGDYGDVRLFRELGLDEKIVIDHKGKMVVGEFKGLPVSEARKKMITLLEEKGFVEKTEEIMHRTPMSERGNCPIEILPMKDYYLKQLPYIDVLKKYSQEIKFHPEEKRQILVDWINSISIDWPITRRRYYGTEVPLWYCKKCGEIVVPHSGKYYRPWKEKPPIERCSCGSTEFIGDERTFDTWMDSSISALTAAQYFKNMDVFKKAFPVSIRPQAKEIIRTWLFYTLLRTHLITNKCAFEHVWISGHGVDEHGKKMSKSKGNVVDPVPVIEKYGADAFRFWTAAEASLGSDYRFSIEKIETSQKFLTKLWNISRFISGFKTEGEKVEKMPADNWIISELNKTIEKCDSGYADFNFFVPAIEIKNFAWNLFADNYLEMVKARAYNKNKEFSTAQQNSAVKTLNLVLENIIKILAPVCPFITEKLWMEMFSKDSVHLQVFPEKIESIAKHAPDLTEKLTEFNSAVWKFKKEKGLSLNSELQELTAPEELSEFSADLKAMHNIKKIGFGKALNIL